jgi:dsDNA-specific endonuclease/ATPase MutS2
MKKDSNIIHDMAKGLRDNRNHKKIRSFLEGLKDTVNNRNIQETMDFSEPKEVAPAIEPAKKESAVANQELSKIRKLLKP